jgi:hypothetical protein
MDLTVEHLPEPVAHLVVSTVTSTIHEVRAGPRRQRVVCAWCHERNEIGYARTHQTDH